MDHFQSREYHCFNTQPPEGGCIYSLAMYSINNIVSTHSRPKAAAFILYSTDPDLTVSTHSRPKAAAGRFHHTIYKADSFNTQPPEGGCFWDQRDINAW